MSNAEQLHTPESGVEAPKNIAEQYERIQKSIEHGGERSVENAEAIEAKARHEALESAISVEAGSAERTHRPLEGPAAAPRRRGGISKKEKAASYSKHMALVQAELPPAERAFSKVIHNPAVEKVSEVVGSTVARPNAILSGAVVAFIVVLAVYITAKNLGYTLSGFETIGAFIAGYVIGVIYDYLRVMVTGKK